MDGVKAVIFDMDGVLIDSEPLWRRAMIAGFGDIGIDFTEDDCRKTTGMRFREVIDHWFQHHTITACTQDDLNSNVINHLIELINNEGQPMTGAVETLEFFKKNRMPIGLATSSSNILIETVLNKLSIRPYFSSIVSAEFLQFGKPHPEVFIKCSEELKVLPKNCLVIEDSLNGVLAAKAAQMKVIAIPDAQLGGIQKFSLADHCVNDLFDVIKLF